MNKSYDNIELNKTYYFEIDPNTVKFGDLTEIECTNTFMDGRPFSFLIEEQLPYWFTCLTRWKKGKVDGLFTPDHVDNNDQFYDEKTFTTSGLYIGQSISRGGGRKPDINKLKKVAKRHIYICVDNTSFPSIRVKFVNGVDFLSLYPDGTVIFQEIDEFYTDGVLLDNSMRELDQFYTNNDVAKQLYDVVASKFDIAHYDWVLEPSAGTGAFYDCLPDNNRIGIDLEPKGEEIEKMDFFNYAFPSGRGLVIGNPPFGQNASLALKFFNRASMYAEVIAFVLPRTFRKKSMTNRMNLQFSLIYEEELPANSFIFKDKKYDVPCVFQIWSKSENLRRKLIKKTTHKSFEIVKSKKSADFAFQRVGAAAGKIKTEFEHCSPQSHYFIKANSDDVLENMRTINFDEIKHNTAGNPSIGLSELVELYSEIVPDYPKQWDDLFV
jgi:hypothetical protein